MTQMLVAVLAGVAVAAIVVVLVLRTAKAAGSSGAATGMGWASLALAVLTVLLVVAGYAFAPEFVSEAEAEAEAASGQFDSQGLYMVGTATGIAAAVTAGLALKRGDRHWPTWVGLLVGAGVIGAWMYVIVYIMFNPY